MRDFAQVSAFHQARQHRSAQMRSRHTDTLRETIRCPGRGHRIANLGGSHHYPHIDEVLKRRLADPRTPGSVVEFEHHDVRNTCGARHFEQHCRLPTES
ncbi:hypothetical protein ACIHDR_47185 [Nocardia sp. NPDC052278]|uniref:hypothetical protein n=1 Tax=unclassified Nocardia TaxID=2637762 RepID=UPI0036B1FD00